VGRAFRGSIGGARVIDEFGDSLTVTQMPGDDWRVLHHNPMMDAVAEMTRRYTEVPVEREPWQLFAGVLAGAAPAAAAAFFQADGEGSNAMRRRALVPDLCVNLLLEDGSRRDVLVEVKTLHRAAAARQPYYCVPDDNRASAAVERRAAQVAAEYPRKARELDAKYFPGGGEPFASRLRAFPPVIPLVFGAFGEANEAVFSFVDKVAHAAAPAWRGHLGVADDVHARALLRGRMIHRLGVSAACAHARLLLRRLDRAVGRGGQRSASSGAPAAARAGDAEDGLSGSSSRDRDMAWPGDLLRWTA
jgi:hypothetical protein